MTKQKKIQRCTGPECDRDAVSDSLCASHRQQVRLGRVLVKLRPRSPNGTTARSKSKPVKAVARKKVNKLLVLPEPSAPKPKSRKRGPLLGLREWICPKCLEGGTFLGSQASHRCTMNKNLITDWVLKENYKSAIEPNP